MGFEILRKELPNLILHVAVLMVTMHSSARGPAAFSLDMSQQSHKQHQYLILGTISIRKTRFFGEATLGSQDSQYHRVSSPEPRGTEKERNLELITQKLSLNWTKGGSFLHILLIYNHVREQRPN